MKKTSSALLLALALTFTACGNSNQAPAENNAPVEQVQEAETPETAETTTEAEVVEETTEEAEAPATEEEATPAAESTSGEKVYNTFIESDPSSVDPQSGGDSYGDKMVMNMYEPLLRFVQDGDGVKLEEAAAESYDVSDDGLTYTFHIREGMVWDDGKPLIAQDFEYGIKRSANPETGAVLSFLLADIENFSAVNNGEADPDELGVKAIDDHTLEFTLSNPATYFDTIVPLRICYPQREDIVDQYGEEFASEADKQIGCGPFKLTEWTHNNQLTLEKSDTYWDKDNVKLDKVNVRIISDTNSIMNAFQAHEIMDVATGEPEWTSVFEKMEGIKSTEEFNPSIEFLYTNHRDPLLANEKVRQAINLAIDREGISQVVMSGNATPAYFWVTDGITLNDLNFREFAGEPLKEIKEANPDLKALMQEGLDEIGEGQKVEDVELSLIMGNIPQSKKLGEFLQNNLQQTLGIKLNLDLVEWPVMYNRVSNNDFQIGSFTWYADYNHPAAVLSLYKSDAEATNAGWSSEEYDKLMKDAAAELDNEKAAEIYKEAEQMIMDQAVIFPTVISKSTMFYQDGVENLNTNRFATTGYKYINVK